MAIMSNAGSKKRSEIEIYSYVATVSEVEENDSNLNIPRYVDTFEVDPEIDIDAVQLEIEQLEVNRVEMAEKLKGLVR